MTTDESRLSQQLAAVARQLLLASDTIAYDIARRHPDLAATVSQAKATARECIDILRGLS